MQHVEHPSEAVEDFLLPCLIAATFALDSIHESTLEAPRFEGTAHDLRPSNPGPCSDCLKVGHATQRTSTDSVRQQDLALVSYGPATREGLTSDSDDQPLRPVLPAAPRRCSPISPGRRMGRPFLGLIRRTCCAPTTG